MAQIATSAQALAGQVALVPNAQPQQLLLDQILVALGDVKQSQTEMKEQMRQMKAEQTEEMRQLKAQVNVLSRRSARAANRSLLGAHTLEPVANLNGEMPDGFFPKTAIDIWQLTGQDLNIALDAYGLSRAGHAKVKVARLAAELGIIVPAQGQNA